MGKYGLRRVDYKVYQHKKGIGYFLCAHVDGIFVGIYSLISGTSDKLEEHVTIKLSIALRIVAVRLLYPEFRGDA